MSRAFTVYQTGEDQMARALCWIKRQGGAILESNLKNLFDTETGYASEECTLTLKPRADITNYPNVQKYQLQHKNKYLSTI